jgi:multidrug efflux pump subunit AcrB
MADNKETNQLETEKHKLGLAGATAKAFINSPLTPMLIIISILMGLAGMAFTPRQEDPQISVPMVDVFVQYPGASAEQVAALVAKPLQRIMGEMLGVKNVFAVSQRDSALVVIEFDVGEEMEHSLIKLYSKLDSNQDIMPPGVTYMVKPKAVDDVPGLAVTLWSNEVDDASLRLIALDTLQKLSEVENSNQGFVVSGRQEQLRVEVLPEKLSGYGISLPKLAQVIQQANSEKSVGDIEAWDKSFKVYTGSFLQSAQDVESIVVGISDGIPVYIRDVANVLHGPSEVSQMVSHYTGPASTETEVANAAPAVTIAIAKKKGSNGVTVYANILERLELLKGEIIPDNVNVYISRNYGETANDKVNELIFKLFIATAIVVLLVWFALGWRPAVVVLIVIPIVILFTVFSALMLGLTIDRVSLFALIFSIGILVDDAIVVIENIYRHWLIEESMSEEVSINAVDEVGNPTILATFTVIAALMPMGAVSGMMGPYMSPIPILGSVAMLFSLFAAFAFTPWLANKIKPSLETLEHHAKKEHEGNQRLGRFFKRTITPLVERSVLGYGFLMSLFVLFFAACVMFYTTAVSVKMLPLDNKSEFQVVVNFPEGTSLITTANLMSALAIEARQFDEVVSLQTYVGTASPYNFNGLVRHYYLRTHPWQADMQVVLTHKNSREITSHEIAVAMREVMTPIATAEGARIQIVEMPPGPPVLQSVVAEIYGPDAETRRQFARDMTEMFEQAESITDVDNLMQQPFEIWRFEVDRDKALRKGITIDSINTTLKMAMGGFVVGDLKRGSVVEPTFIILQVPLSVRSEFSRLGTIPVQAPDGSMLPLSELGQFVKDVEQDIIFHKNLREVEFVTGENAGELAAPIYGMFQVDDMLADYIAPDGVIVDHGFFSGGFFGPPENSSKTGFEWTGEWTVTYETFRDMGGAFILAMIIIYMLVVIEFKNFIFPAIIMAPIPLTLVGIIPGHWFFGAEFTATSMIGWIALAGIIVRNSILLVDFTKHEVRRGVPVIDAVINSCQARTRPIVITALALVGGSSVILTDPIFEGMAISLLFGVVVSTALTLFVIPLGCISAKKAFLCEDGREDGIARADDSTGADSVVVEEEDKAPIWMRLYSAIIGLVGWIIAIFAMVFNLLRMLVGMLLPKSEPPASEPPPPASTPPTAPAPAPVEKAVATSEKTEVKKVVITEKSTISEDVPAKKAVKNVSVKAAVAKTVVTEKSAIATPVEKPATTKKVVTKKAVTKKTAAKKATAKTVATTAAAAKAATVNKAVVKKVARKKVVKKKTVTKAVPVKKVVAKKIPSKKISSGARRGIRLKNDDS